MSLRNPPESICSSYDVACEILSHESSPSGLIAALEAYSNVFLCRPPFGDHQNFGSLKDNSMTHVFRLINGSLAIENDESNDQALVRPSPHSKLW